MDDAADDGRQVCPGYCGRNRVESTGNWSDCESCHWGERSFNRLVCSTCDLPLSAYDWLYLGFIAMLPLLLHSFFIEYYATKRSRRRTLLLQHACSVFECAASALLAVLLVPPVGRPTLLGCGRTELKDWYTMAYNPVINYSYTLRCTQEAVFPLYSLPFMYLGVCLVSLAVVRWAVLCAANERDSGASRAVYAALYAVPLLALGHALLAGLIYYSFAFILLLTSLATNAVHLASYQSQTMRALVHLTLTRPRNLCIVVTHMFLFGYSILSLALLFDPPNWPATGVCMLFVPTPAIFYIGTVGLTHSSKLTISE